MCGRSKSMESRELAAWEMTLRADLEADHESKLFVVERKLADERDRKRELDGIDDEPHRAPEIVVDAERAQREVRAGAVLRCSVDVEQQRRHARVDRRTQIDAIELHREASDDGRGLRHDTGAFLEWRRRDPWIQFAMEPDEPALVQAIARADRTDRCCTIDRATHR